jgi:Ala-tRNA(Pro) deacylase
MARHAISGMMATGLISGITIYIIFPRIRRSFRRFSGWLMDKSMTPFKTNLEEIDISTATCLLRNDPSKSSVKSEDAEHDKQKIASSSSSDDETEIKSSSSSYSDDETEIKNNKESAITVELPENGKLVIQKIETFNIFTETVKYNAKNERNISDKTVYCKNLFLKDRKGKFYYVICHEDNNVNLRQLKYKLHAHRNFSFASAEEAYQHLHVEPDCITPFVFLSEAVSKDIVVAISRELMFEKHLNFHPLHAEFTTRISFGLLLKLFGHLKRKLCILDI